MADLVTGTTAASSLTPGGSPKRRTALQHEYGIVRRSAEIAVDPT